MEFTDKILVKNNNQKIKIKNDLVDIKGLAVSVQH